MGGRQEPSAQGGAEAGAIMITKFSLDIAPLNLQHSDARWDSGSWTPSPKSNDRVKALSCLLQITSPSVSPNQKIVKDTSELLQIRNPRRNAVFNDAGGQKRIPVAPPVRPQSTMSSPVKSSRALTPTTPGTVHVESRPGTVNLLLKRQKRLVYKSSKFKLIASQLPGIKFDKPAKESIVSTLKRLNYWSESDSESEDNEEKPTKIKSKLPHTSGADIQDSTILSNASMTHAVELGNSARLHPLTELGRSMREMVRQHFIKKAVAVCIAASNRKIQEEKNGMLGKANETALQRRNDDHMFSINRVHRIIMKALAQATEKLVTARVEAQRVLGLQLAAQRFIFKAWRKCRCRVLCRSLLEYLRKHKKLSEQERFIDTCEYRIRASRRQVTEDDNLRAVHAQWRYKYKTNYNNTNENNILKHQHHIYHHHNHYNQLTASTQQDQLYRQPVNVNQADVPLVRTLPATADCEVAYRLPVYTSGHNLRNHLNNDKEYFRPDLGPFSSGINSMVEKQMLSVFKDNRSWLDVAKVSSEDVVMKQLCQSQSVAYKILNNMMDESLEQLNLHKLSNEQASLSADSSLLTYHSCSAQDKWGAPPKISRMLPVSPFIDIT